jgi:hypothetical protein
MFSIFRKENRMSLLRCISLSLALILMFAPVSWADNPFSIGTVKFPGTLCVIDGKAVLGIGSEEPHYSDWSLQRSFWTKPTQIALMNAGDFTARGIGYVVLEKGEIVVGLNGSKPEGSKEEIDLNTWQFQRGWGCYIEANVGPRKGWYLSAMEKVEEAKDCKGKPYKFHKLTLLEKPTERSIWNVGQSSP